MQLDFQEPAVRGSRLPLLPTIQPHGVDDRNQPVAEIADHFQLHTLKSKLDYRAAVVRGTRHRAQSGCWCFENSCPLPAIDPPAENGSATTIDHLKYDLEPERGISF